MAGQAQKLCLEKGEERAEPREPRASKSGRERARACRSGAAHICKWASFLNSRALPKEPEVPQLPGHEAALSAEQTWVQGSFPSPLATGPGLTQSLLSLRTQRAERFLDSYEV